jgi:outer membrane protein TolC
VLRQEVTLSNTKAELNRLLGRTEARTRFAVSDRIPLDTTLSYASLQQAAEASSPALRQARQALDAARAEQREVRADYFPSIDVFVGAGVSESESEAGFVQSQTINDLRYGASLTFDVFDGFNRERQRQNAAIRAENARLAVEAARAQLSAALSSAFESYRNRIRLVQLERENLEAATANVDVALEQFRLGTITSVELREVQEQRIQAESRLLTARFEAKRAEIELLRLSGQLHARRGL